MRSPQQQQQQPGRLCEDIVREHERLRNPLRPRPAKTAILGAQAQRLREQEAELRGRQIQKAGVDGNIASMDMRSGSGYGSAPARPALLPGRSPPSGGTSGSGGTGIRARGASGGVPVRQPLMLLADRDVSGEVRRGARGGGGDGGGDPYSVINTLQRAALAGSGPASPSSPAGGGRRYISPPRQSPAGRRSAGTSPTAPYYASGWGVAASPLLRPPSMEAAVSVARARVQLEAAVASSQRGSPSPAPPPGGGFEAARALAMSLPPFVIAPPHLSGAVKAEASASPCIAERQQHREWGHQEADPSQEFEGYQQHAAPAAARDAFLPPPGLLAQMMAPSSGDGGGRPRMAPWELGQQLQDSLRK